LASNRSARGNSPAVTRCDDLALLHDQGLEMHGRELFARPAVTTRPPAGSSSRLAPARLVSGDLVRVPTHSITQSTPRRWSGCVRVPQGRHGEYRPRDRRQARRYPGETGEVAHDGRRGASAVAEHVEHGQSELARPGSPQSRPAARATLQDVVTEPVHLDHRHHLHRQVVGQT